MAIHAKGLESTSVTLEYIKGPSGKALVHKGVDLRIELNISSDLSV
jgi:hypothetical protein